MTKKYLDDETCIEIIKFLEEAAREFNKLQPEGSGHIITFDEKLSMPDKIDLLRYAYGAIEKH